MNEQKHIDSEYFNLKQCAEYLGLSISTVRNVKSRWHWAGWERYGVRPSRMPGTRILLFKKTDLDKLMEAIKVY